ncbi:MAG: diguanylate cyclase [Proteobacteria bacterium]|nr:diguanylate cyclase [Pseudomonadota bacterium]
MVEKEMNGYVPPRILVVDDSRMVRASIIKHLHGHFDIREETDGEAAWQTLVLDLSVVAVISDIQMPRLDGFGLLTRVRSSRLKRLQEIPFILVSGAESEEERDRAKALGVSDFITKGIGTAEILTRLNHLLELARTRHQLEESRKQMVQDMKSGVFTRKFIELQAAQALSHAARHNSEVSVIVLGLDNFDQIIEDIGTDLADQVATRFAQLLAGKMRKEDNLGIYDRGQYVIVSPGVSPARCASFADRVREAVKVAHVAVQGRRLQLTVSAGVANAPQDRVVSAGLLLELAAGRLHEAMQAGGNRIVLGGVGKDAVVSHIANLNQALEFLKRGQVDAVRPQAAEFGLQILPLLRMLDQEFDLKLPLTQYAQRLGAGGSGAAPNMAEDIPEN